VARDRERSARDRARAAKGEKKRSIGLANLHLVPAEALITPQARGFAECPCTKECVLHGDCRLCVAYHARKSASPRCER
jgi:hypothetical protein